MSSRPPTARSRTGGSRRRGKRADGDEVKAESEESERGTSSPRPMFSRTGSGSNLSRGGGSDGSGLPQSPPTRRRERRTPCQTEGGPAAADAGVRRGRRAGKAGALCVRSRRRRDRQKQKRVTPQIAVLLRSPVLLALPPSLTATSRAPGADGSSGDSPQTSNFRSSACSRSACSASESASAVACDIAASCSSAASLTSSVSSAVDRLIPATSSTIDTASSVLAAA